MIHRRRLRRLAALVVVIAAGAAAFVVPKLVIGDGLEDLSGQSREIGQAAIDQARIGCLDSPLERAVTLQIRLQRLEASADHDGQVRRVLLDGYRAELQTYTVLGLPSRKIVIDGDIRCDA